MFAKADVVDIRSELAHVRTSREEKCLEPDQRNEDRDGALRLVELHVAGKGQRAHSVIE